MPHTYECPMRWADMDLLGHVNNVTYLDYVAEAREDLFQGTGVDPSSVTSHQVEFASPLVFRRKPVHVDSWFTAVGDDEVTLAHEIYDAPAEPGGERTLYLRASSVLSASLPPMARDLALATTGPAHEWRPLAERSTEAGDLYELTIRRADVDGRGLVRDVAFFEFLQEARIKFLMGLHTRGQHWSHHVVARTDVDLVEPMPHRRAPYAVRSWIGHVGTRSFTIRAEVLDGDRVLARAGVVMVIFDMETQRPTDMAESQRERLLEELSR